jgi:hypothetical protein
LRKGYKYRSLFPIVDRYCEVKCEVVNYLRAPGINSSTDNYRYGDLKSKQDYRQTAIGARNLREYLQTVLVLIMAIFGITTLAVTFTSIFELFNLGRGNRL